MKNTSLFILPMLRPFAQRACLKFARYIGATPIAGRFTPGAFTNQIQAAFREPRLLVISDPRTDHQVGVNYLKLFWVVCTWVIFFHFFGIILQKSQLFKTYWGVLKLSKFFICQVMKFLS